MQQNNMAPNILPTNETEITPVKDARNSNNKRKIFKRKKKKVFGAEVKQIIRNEQNKNERVLAFGRAIIAVVFWIVLIIAKSGIPAGDFIQLTFVIVFITVNGSIAIFFFVIKKIFPRVLVYFVAIGDIAALVAAVLVMGEPVDINKTPESEVEKRVAFLIEEVSELEQARDNIAVQFDEENDDWKAIANGLDLSIDSMNEEIDLLTTNINNVARYKTGVFEILFVFLVLSMLRFSSKLTMIVAFLPVLIFSGFYVYDAFISDAGVRTGESTYSYYTQVVSTDTVILRYLSYLLIGFILMKVTRKNTEILEDSLTQQISTQLEKKEVEGIVGQLTRISDSIVNGKNVLEKSVARATESVNDIIQVINQSEQKVREEMKQVQQVSGHITAMTEWVSNIHDSTLNQSSHVEESSSSVQELSSSIMNVSNTIKEADELFNILLSATEQGKGYTDETVKAIRDIQEASEHIKGVIKVLGGIADKTNILAMNATIQAAHAGQYGRPFAVVAGEVRKLAANSANSSKEISNNIEDIVGRIHKGVLLAEKTFTSLDDIYNQITQTRGVMSEIATAATQQTSSAREVLNSISTLLNLTEENKKKIFDTKEESNKMQNVLVDLNAATVEVRAFINEINQRKSNIEKAINHIEGVIHDAGQMIDEMANVVKLFEKVG